MLESPYLIEKGITLEELQNASSAKIRVGKGRILFERDGNVAGEHNGLFVYRELVDFTHQHVGTERILDTKIDKYGNGKPGNKFCTGKSDTAGFTPFGFDPRDLLFLKGDLVVCAGLADGYRIHQATGYPVACVVGENTIPKLAQFIASVTRRGEDGLNVIVATDNDRAGFLAAHRSGLPYAIPSAQKDFSDVYQHGGGLDAVRWQVERYMPPLPLPQREAEIERLSGRTSNDYQPPRNTMAVQQDSAFPMGYCVGISIPKPHLIDGYDQLKTIAHTMNDCVFELDEGDQWLLSEPDELTLAVTMMDAGLMTSVDVIPINYHPMREELLHLIREEGLDDVQVPGGIPALVTFGSDKKGPCLIVDTHFDAQIAQICRDAKGFFDRDAQEWRISIATPRQRDMAIDAICGNPLRRFMFKSPTNENQWTVATPWTADAFDDCVRAHVACASPNVTAPDNAPAMSVPGR